MKKIGIIGYGNIAQKHLEVFRALGCNEIASCNRSESGREKAKADGIQHIFPDPGQLIANFKPDALVVCVSFWNIFQVMKELIPYKIPILVEKPSGTSLQEHLELVRMAETEQCSVMLGLNRRHYSVLNKAIEDAGGRENITELLIEWSEEPIRLLDNKGYNNLQTGMAMLSNTIHGLDTITYVAGRLNNESIHTVNRGDRFRWFMNLSAVSEKNILVNFNSNWENAIPWRIVITSPGKRYVFAPLESCQVFEGKSKEPRIIEADETDKTFKAGFYRQAELFLKQDIRGFELSSANESMRLAEKLYKAFNPQTAVTS